MPQLWKIILVILLFVIVCLNPAAFYFLWNPQPIAAIFHTTKKVVAALALLDCLLLAAAFLLWKLRPKNGEVAMIVVTSMLCLWVADFTLAKVLRRGDGARHEEILQHPAFAKETNRSKLAAALAEYEGSTGRKRAKFNTLYFFDAPEYRIPDYSSTRVFNKFTVRSSVNPTSTQKPVVVWFFGGSTMYSSYTFDGDTIPSLVSRLAADAGTPITAYNFGFSGNNISYELVNFIQVLKNSPVKPDLVVFYDGFNDSGTSLAFGETHFSVRRWLAPPIEYDYWQNAVYNFTSWLCDRSVLFGRLMGDRLVELYVSWSYDFSPEHIARIENNYTQSIELARAVAQSRRVETVFFLQPMLFTKAKPHTSEQRALNPELDAPSREVYQRIRAANAAKPYFHDISNVFDAHDEAIFYDQGHVAAAGNQIISRRIFSEISQKLRRPR